MALLADLAAASRRVSETASRNAKIAELAACLRGLAPDEIPIAISFLTGETRQGKLGVAYAALRDGNWGASPPGPSLSVQEVDTAFAGLAATSGKGSAGGRAERLAALGLPGARVDIVLAHKIGLAGEDPLSVGSSLAGISAVFRMRDALCQRTCAKVTQGLNGWRYRARSPDCVPDSYNEPPRQERGERKSALWTLIPWRPGRGG